MSPIHLLFGSLAGDYEQAVGRDVSFGVGATYGGANSILRSATSGGYDVDVSAKARYYLYGTAPAGASVGVVGGFVYGRRQRRSDADPTASAARNQTVPTFGFTLDHDQFLGRSRRLVLGTGTDVKRRYTGAVDGAYEGFDQVQFTFRFLAGYAW